jgi:plastocyanin domain-containing protein
MLFTKTILSVVASIGLLAGGKTVSPSAFLQTSLLHQNKPTLWVKGAVTATGLALIGLEIWWFVLNKPKSQKASSHNGIQQATIIVDGGYEPAQVVVNAGRPVRLNFLRRDRTSCLETVLFPDFHIAQHLELNQVTPIEFLPQKPGQYTFTCGMNMFRGVVQVKAANSFKEI